jgi:hypothetical protein
MGAGQSRICNIKKMRCVEREVIKRRRELVRGFRFVQLLYTS